MDGEARPPRRVTGRILSLGFPLPGVRVDNYNILNAPAFFDYDALVVSPAAIGDLIENVVAGTTEVLSFAGARIVATAAAANDAALAHVLARRREETERLLAHGGVIVCFAHPETHHDIGSADGYGTYDWLGASPRLIAGEGSSAHVVDAKHPLAPFVLSQAANIAYRSHIDVAALPGARVFAQSYGGAAIAAEVPSPRGRVVLLPALRALPAGDARYAMSEALQAGIRRMLGTVAEGREPHWLAAQEIPGLTERSAASAEARAAAEAAAAALADAERHEAELSQYRALLWQEGVAGLEPVVHEALRLVGFHVYAQNADEVELRDPGSDASILLEIDAADEAIGMAAHYRLRQRTESAIQRRAAAPRGLIVANGFRLQAPSGRPVQASAPLRLAAETMRYCIAPSTALFDAVVSHLRGDAEAVAAFRRALATFDGYVESFGDASAR